MSVKRGAGASVKQAKETMSSEANQFSKKC